MSSSDYYHLNISKRFRAVSATVTPHDPGIHLAGSLEGVSSFTLARLVATLEALFNFITLASSYLETLCRKHPSPAIFSSDLDLNLVASRNTVDT